MNRAIEGKPVNRRAVLTAAVIAIVFLLLLGWWAGPVVHALWSAIREVGIVVLLGFATAFCGWRGWRGLTGGGRWGWWTGAAAMLLIASIGIGALLSYISAHKLYAASSVSTTTDASSLSFEPRAPYDVASQVSGRYLGDNVGTVTGTVKSVPSLGEYTTSVKRRGIGKGYEAVQVMKLPTLGTATNSDVTFCKYSTSASKRFGGMLPGNGLGIALSHRISWSTRWNRGDAFAVCDNGTPKLYIPLTRLKRWIAPIRVPAGVAVYNGRTGALTIHRRLHTDLPVYPASVAKAQRESSKASGSIAGWFFSRVGWESSDAADSKDPNRSNPTEFALANSTGQTQYVTPLTPRGSSSSIVAISTVYATSNDAGSLSPLEIHRFTTSQSRPANSTTAANIISTKLSGYKASGLTVFEIVPAENGTWAASIGKSQSILYRATIDPDGVITLKSADDGDSTGSTDSTTTVPGNGTPLDKMTDAQLHAYIDKMLAEAAAANAKAQKANDELARRK